MTIHLVAAEKIRNDIRRLADLALAQRQSKRFTEAVVEVQQELHSSPAEWGDPSRRHQALGLTQFHRACSPLFVTYSVDEQRRIVYLQSVSFMPNSGLVE